MNLINVDVIIVVIRKHSRTVHCCKWNTYHSCSEFVRCFCVFKDDVIIDLVDLNLFR